MRLPRVRFTMRRMLVAVAIVGIIVGVEMGRRRRMEFLVKASWHKNQENSYQNRVEALEAVEEMATNSPFVKNEVLAENRNRRKSAFLALVNYHASLGEKYERAARFPWLSVSPDSAEPPIPVSPPVRMVPFPRIPDPSKAK